MASAFGHALAAIGIGKGMLFREKLKFWLLGMFCAIVPDADVIGFKFGVAYGNMFGHRGFTHSFAFALILGSLVVWFFYKEERAFSRKWWLLLLYFFLATASHPILDAFTNGGYGVAFFSPFNNERYFFPWRPIQVSPIGAGNFFSTWGLNVLKSEGIWIGIPSLVVILIARIFRKK